MSSAGKKPIWMELLAAGVVAAAVSALVALYMDYRSFHRARDHEALEQVIGPVVMHLSRTRAVHERYGKTSNQIFRDALIMRDSNATVRTLLIDKAHLLPGKLMAAAQCLVSHYDIWLNAFEHELEIESADGSPPELGERFDVGFVDGDPAFQKRCGTGFPDDAPELFEEEFTRLRGELYGL